MVFKRLRNAAFPVNVFLYTISGAHSGYSVSVYITFRVVSVALYYLVKYRKLIHLCIFAFSI